MACVICHSYPVSELFVSEILIDLCGKDFKVLEIVYSATPLDQSGIWNLREEVMPFRGQFRV